MLGSLVLGKRRDTPEPLGPLVVDVLAERPTGDTHLGGHLPGFRLEVIFPPPHQSFIEPEDLTVQLEEIHHGIVVLKAVHSPDGRGQEGPCLQGLPKHRLESRDQVLSCGLRQ